MRAKYGFIASCGIRYPVDVLCRVMKVSRSCYYAYRACAAMPERSVEEAVRVRDCFYKNSRRYGSRRIAAELGMGRFLVRRLMRGANLEAIQPRAFRPRTTDSGLDIIESVKFADR